MEPSFKGAVVDATMEALEEELVTSQGTTTLEVTTKEATFAQTLLGVTKEVIKADANKVVTKVALNAMPTLETTITIKAGAMDTTRSSIRNIMKTYQRINTTLKQSITRKLRTGMTTTEIHKAQEGCTKITRQPITLVIGLTPEKATTASMSITMMVT